jgi:hypothetical protein
MNNNNTPTENALDTDTQSVNQLEGLNRKARKYLMSILISVKGYDVTAFGFSGYINGNEVTNITLVRENKVWSIIEGEKILSIRGEVRFFTATLK